MLFHSKEHSAHGGGQAAHRARQHAQARDAVVEIDAALERIRKGVYGVCVKSGKNIPRERLEIIPWASQRVEFKAGGLGRR